MSKAKPDPLGQAVQHKLDQLEGRQPIAQANVGGDQELTAEQRAKLPFVAVMGMPCFLNSVSLVCEEKPNNIHFRDIPERMRHGRKEDRIYFTICAACGALPDVHNRIDAEMERRLGG